MIQRLSISLTALLIAFAFFRAVSAEEPLPTTTLGEIKFTLAKGLALQQVAAEPLIRWPVVADWDSQGRLVVVESGGVGWPIQEHNQQLLHRVVRLVDQDQDGIFDSRIVAADKLPFAEGVLCLGDSLLVGAPPNIWKLTDRDGDGICEEREVWFDGQTVTNCANDLHGPYLGLDGWIYWCKGAFGEQTHALLDGRTLHDQAAHIYRRRIEGGAIESVISGGMDNPVEVAMTPEGEQFFTSTFLQHPGDGRRDGIAHAVYGGVFGKDHHVLDALVRTGPLMPIMTHLGPAAPSGLTCLEKSDLVEATGGQSAFRTLVAAQFNLQKVTAHRLEPAGASFTTADSDLLVADRVDFHPTDILEDHAGNLIVLDTGGWYDLCCPTSRVNQKTAAGGIYRLTRQAWQAPSGEAIDWDATSADVCVTLLEDARPWVRRMAKLKLMRSGDSRPALDQLAAILHSPSQPLDKRLNSLWALCAIATDDALDSIAAAIDLDQPSIVQAACHALGLNRFRPASRAVQEVLAKASEASHGSPQVVRAALEALGRFGDDSLVALLLETHLAAGGDSALQHASLNAILEMDSPRQIASFLASPSLEEQAVALQALHALKDDEFLNQPVVLQALSDRIPAAIEILIDHPQWADEVAPEIEQQLASGRNSVAELRRLFAAWRTAPAVQGIVADLIRLPRDTRQFQDVLELLGSFEGVPLPASWVEPLTSLVATAPEQVAPLLRKLDLSPSHCRPLADRLIAEAMSSPNLPLRLQLLAALPPNSQLDAEAMQSIVDLFSDEQGRHRAACAEVLARLRLTKTAAVSLAEQCEKVEPRYLLTALESIASAGNDALDESVLRQLSQIPAARSLPADQIRNVYRGRSAKLSDLAKSVAESLMLPPQDIQTAVDALLSQLPAGDSVRGLQVYRSAKAACSACHQMGYVGKKIGPELTRIGASRTRAALLEAMLFPSARIEQSFQPVSLLTVEGEVHNGLFLEDLGDSLKLQIAADKTVLVPIDDIEQRQPGSVSIMPAGLGEALSLQEIADLLQLLESAK